MSALKQFIQPTIGVSFGLPGGAFGSDYPLNPLGNNPLVNPYGGINGGNGVNFGAFNVNPLVSLQFGKGELGQKKFRPLVNFHVTPSAEKLAELGVAGFGGGVGGIGPGLGGGLGGLGGFGGGLGGLGGAPFRQSTENGQLQTSNNNNNFARSLNNQQQQQQFSTLGLFKDGSEPIRFESDNNNKNDHQFSSTAINPNDIVKQGGSAEPFRFSSSSSSNTRPLRSAADGPLGEEAPLNLGEVGQGLHRSGLASEASEASFKIGHHNPYKAFEKEKEKAEKATTFQNIQ